MRGERHGSKTTAEAQGVLCSAALSYRIKAQVRGAQLGMPEYRNTLQDEGESKVKPQSARLVVAVVAVMMMEWWFSRQLFAR